MAFELYQTHIDPLNQTYEGPAQEAVFFFNVGPEQFDFVNNFFVSQYIGDCKQAVEQESPGDRVLMLHVYRDDSPFWTTDYKLVITATDITGNPLPWASIILIGLAAILAYLFVRPVIQSVTDLLYGPDGGGGGPTLVSMLPWIAGAVAVGLIVSALPSKAKR
jgi:hypothetical protein